MPGSRDRYRISREDIGILMSFATRPDRITDDVVHRLGKGVTHAELLEIAEWVGLPRSTASRLIKAGGPASPPVAGTP
ncbi:MAG: hypothetical protein OEO77_01595 [Acidimicrobiia bacterium]|nr:hypothetical protein [Acidimicrobiia bacterium]